MSLYYLIKRKLFPVDPNRPIPDFTPQFRLEGRARTGGAGSQSLAMRVADPLWMLGRQWQFGEFQAEDNGSPIHVSAYFNKEKAGFFSFTENGSRYALAGAPFEARVEAMRLANNPSNLDIKSKVRIGRRFERLLVKHLSNRSGPLIRSMREDFALEHKGAMDDASRRFFRMMAGKVIDGGMLVYRIKQKRTPWQTPSGRTYLLPNDIKTLKKVVEPELMNWYQQFYVQPKAEEAWKQKQLAHEFTVHHKKTANQSHFSLHAPDYQSGHLDWYSFDTANVDSPVSNPTTAFEELIPTNVSFPSLPNKRLYSFEDSKIDLTKMNVDAGELMKTMLIDFALVSGNDWYTIPMKMTPGELCWVNRIEVQDVFGVTTIIKNDKDAGPRLDEHGLKVWDIFKIRNKNIAPEDYADEKHFLFLAPATTMRLESEPLEEILFLRDEYANMVWALERRVSNAMGKPRDGFDLHLEVKGPFINPDTTVREHPLFRLASTVPSNWIPFLPKHADASNTEIVLKQAMMMKNEDATAPEPVKPLTWLLDKDITEVWEEAIPRAGVRVQITNQRVRWTDGKTYVWRGRKVLAGRGEGNSGLHFDYLLET